MKIGEAIGSFTVSLTGVFQMVNFNPLTVSFWATITGIFVFAVFAGYAGESIQINLNKFMKWIFHGRRKYLREQ